MKTIYAMLSLCAVFLSACMVVSPLNYSPKERIFQFGKPGETKEVSINDSVLHYRVEYLTDGLLVTENIIHKALITVIKIPKGFYPKTGEDDTQIYFSPISIKGNEAFVSGYITNNIVYNKERKTIFPTIVGDILLLDFDKGFRLEHDRRIKATNEDFDMRSLNYKGAHDSILSFEYREGDNVQRISHNMANGDVFEYGGAKIKILKYTPNYLKCTILEGFNIFR